MDKTKKIVLLSNIILVGFFLAVVYHYVLGTYLNLGFPSNTFLFAPEFHFNDFTGILPKIKTLQPYSLPADWQNYFPLAFIFILPFAYFKSLVLAYLIFAGGFLAFFVYFNYKNFTCEKLSKIQNLQNIFILSILSYPLLYLVDRGNLDMLIFVFFTMFVYLFKKEKYILSAVFLAIINAMKPFGILFPVLFLFKKRYKEFFLSLGLTFLFILGGFLFFKGNILNQIIILIQSWSSAAQDFIYKNNNNFGMVSQSSLFMMLKLLFCKTHGALAISTLKLVKIYNVLSILITILIAFFAYKEKIFWKQITLLTLYMILVPSISIDYKLIFLYPAIWLFVDSKTIKEKSRFDWLYTVLLGLLLIPKNIILNDYNFAHGALFSTSIIINPLIIMTLICLIIFEQLKGRGLND